VPYPHLLLELKQDRLSSILSKFGTIVRGCIHPWATLALLNLSNRQDINRVHFLMDTPDAIESLVNPLAFLKLYATLSRV